MSSHATPATVIFFFFPRHCRTTSAGHRSDLAPAKLLCPSLYSAPLPSLDLNQHCCRLCPSADSRVRLCPRTDLPISGYSGAGSAKFFLCSSRKKRVDWGSNLAPVRAIVVDHRQTIRIWVDDVRRQFQSLVPIARSASPLLITSLIDVVDGLRLMDIVRSDVMIY
ncbi:uncharacterized protein LOC121978332 [Zingiber officinale]|uniref:uncharacterized protein LOC121978332 n=1 Tax=Zingiber officinale TaxID=94328 RepID=UPI001C4D9D62|nr:uncharacterized protein LOC121978332 [Zingiber officinale]